MHCITHINIQRIIHNSNHWQNVLTLFSYQEFVRALIQSVFQLVFVGWPVWSNLWFWFVRYVDFTVSVPLLLGVQQIILLLCLWKMDIQYDLPCNLRIKNGKNLSFIPLEGVLADKVNNLWILGGLGFVLPLDGDLWCLVVTFGLPNFDAEQNQN